MGFEDLNTWMNWNGVNGWGMIGGKIDVVSGWGGVFLERLKWWCLGKAKPDPP